MIQDDRLHPIHLDVAEVELPRPFDPREWTTYELQFRGKQCHILVNGQEEAAIERSKTRQGGLCGLLSQQCQWAVRKMEAIQR